MEDSDPFDDLDKLREVIHDAGGKSGDASKDRSGSKPSRSVLSGFDFPGGDIGKLFRDGWPIVVLALAFILFFTYLLNTSVYLDQYGSWVFIVYIFVLVGVILFYLMVILPGQREAEERMRKNEEIEKSIIRKNLEKRRAVELEILDGDERDYLLDKWVEEEYSLTLWVEKEYLRYLKGENTILSSKLEKEL